MHSARRRFHHRIACFIGACIAAAAAGDHLPETSDGPCRNEGSPDLLFSIVTTDLVSPTARFANDAQSLAFGDVDGDGFTDIAIGEPNCAFGRCGDTFRRGLVRVYSLRTGQVLAEVEGPAWADPSEINAFGYAVALLDIDGDGLDEIAVGAPARNGAAGGAVYLFRADGELLATRNGPPSLGRVLRNVGDLDGDGAEDLAATAPFNDTIDQGDPAFLLRGEGLSTIEAFGSGTILDIEVLGDVTGTGAAVVALRRHAAYQPTDPEAVYWYNPATQGFEFDYDFDEITTVPDYDDDGVPDLAVVDDDKLLVRSFPLGSLGFIAFWSSPGGVPLASADFDGDGEEEIARHFDDLLRIDGLPVIDGSAAHPVGLLRYRTPGWFGPAESMDIGEAPLDPAIGPAGAAGVAPIAFLRRVRTPGEGDDPVREVLEVSVFQSRLCPGDIDGDGAVLFNDLNAVLSAFGAVPPTQPLPAADLNCDRAVGFNDLNTVLSNFGASCE